MRCPARRQVSPTERFTSRSELIEHLPPRGRHGGGSCIGRVLTDQALSILLCGFDRREPEPTTKGCYSCAQSALAQLPPRERIYDDGLWRIAHAFNAARVGWLVFVLRRHVESLGELTPAEAAVFGRLVPAASRALEAELGVSKAYVMFLAELEHFQHVHVHVVARPSLELRGTKVFDLLKRPREEWVTEADMDAFAARIAARLGDGLRG